MQIVFCSRRGAAPNKHSADPLYDLQSSRRRSPSSTRVSARAFIIDRPEQRSLSFVCINPLPHHSRSHNITYLHNLLVPFDASTLHLSMGKTY